MQLFLCDLEIDKIEEELPRHGDELVDTLATLGIEIDPWRAARDLASKGILPCRINGKHVTRKHIKRMYP